MLTLIEQTTRRFNKQNLAINIKADADLGSYVAVDGHWNKSRLNGKAKTSKPFFFKYEKGFVLEVTLMYPCNIYWKLC